MSSKTYFIDTKMKRITIPSSRWYETPFGTFPSVTSILQMRAKQGLTTWQTNLALNGIDPKEVSRNAMDEGSRVHNACEQLIYGNELSFLDADGNENYKLFEEWLPIYRFTQAFKRYQINPILVEQNIYNGEIGYAGTMDMLCTLIPDGRKTPVLALLDLKRSSSVSVEYKYQISAYIRSLKWMTDNVDGFKDIDSSIVRGYILLLNVDTKSGYRLVEIENLDNLFNGFMACKTLFDEISPDIETANKIYPSVIKLWEEEYSTDKQEGV